MTCNVFGETLTLNPTLIWSESDFTFEYLRVDVVKGLVRSWTVQPCVQHWCEDGAERTNDLKENCTCPPVSH